jgi:hypothetical protein
MLEDGTYDAIVVDAEAASEDASAVTLDVTVLAGPHKGEVVSMSATGTGRDPLDLLGVPATLTVAGGQPSLRLEG